MPVSYKRYLRRSFHESFDIFGMDERMAFRKSAPQNPFGGKGETGRGVGGRENRHKRRINELSKEDEKEKEVGWKTLKQRIIVIRSNHGVNF